MTVNIEKLAVTDVSAGASEHNVHDEYKSLSIAERKSICDRETLGYSVAIINVTGELNVGNIIRSASLCGANDVHVLGRRKYDKRGTVGAENYINVYRENMVMDNDPLSVDIDLVVKYFDDNDLYPIFVEQFDSSNCNKIRGLGGYANAVSEIIDIMGRTPVLVFGNENRGIPHELINRYPYACRYVVELSQRGVLRSFNVGSSAAIVLYNMMTSLT